MQWYYVENGQQAGPVDETALAELVASGKIDQATLVWCASMANWEPYASVAPRLGGAAADPGAPPAAVPAGASAVCVECGRPFPQDEMVQYGSAFVCADCKNVFFQKIREGVGVTGDFRYAGFWIRAGAKIIDGILLAIVLYPLGMLLNAGASVNPLPFRSGFNVAVLFSVSTLLNMAIHLTYYVYLHGRFGQSLGKMACGIRVIRSDGSPITYGRALGRFFGDMLSGLVLYIGYIMAGFDKEKRALHDHICDTRVVYWVKR